MEMTFFCFSFVLIILQWVSCTGQVMFDPNFPMQDQIIASNFRPIRPMPGNPQFRTPNRNWVSASQSPLLHMGPAEPKAASADSASKQNRKNVNFSELVNAFSDLAEDKEEVPEERTSTRAYGYPAYSQPQQYGYDQRPSYGPQLSYLPPSSNHESYAPPPPVHHHTDSKISLLKPALDLVKPVTTKVASKVSGLIGLVLALLTGSSPDDLELKGFKDIVINGIVKPLMLAKGGIKSLISKLAIPVISLLLINLEVLITIWWLWEDCPEPVPAPSYQKPSYNYNNY